MHIFVSKISEYNDLKTINKNKNNNNNKFNKS
jgi:hypothetical protein